MKKSLKVLSFALLSVTALHRVFVIKAEAYIDPGTSGFVFSSLGYILAAAAAGLGVIIYPIRRLLRKLKGRSALQGKSPQEPSPAQKP